MRARWTVLPGLLTFGPVVFSAAQAQTGSQMSVPALPQVIRPDGPVQGGSMPGFGGTTAAAQVATDGHFHFQALLNGVPVPMLFDTGASFIALRAEDAGRLGIDPATLTYSLSMNTANGRTLAAPVTLASVSVGGITRTNVRAVVHAPGGLSENLLGQSFLARIGGYRQTGNRLVLVGD